MVQELALSGTWRKYIELVFWKYIELVFLEWAGGKAKGRVPV